ncbi:ABSCISIC ACID RESPONSIVE ELEMENTS-BINDING PROTEIN 2 [Hibiscus trionum]|uniref:ABSCISIC ACID RESPONSIVE ELEMENTS-BINDING PROTEIN 2 n=1 Tax=Hibiscus trionum TaxID=183268 RepID=A0A9W7HJF2_HIBTR|nr:ABSCISIC ACID RESPONSIVE ELEMENTS-BINDING PROTEIN 2 [Hibiscus trionum]
MATNMNFGSSQAADGGGNTLLSRQASIYSLTLDEFQSSMGGIGKDFGSMNMDELLKNIWSAEETQTMAPALDGNGGLQRQGSLTFPRTLSQKTVDEVWKDISKEYSIGKDGIGTAGPGSNNNMPQSQQTLGEMTLEEFLVRAGAVREDIQFAGNQIGFQPSNLPFNVNGVNSNLHQPIFPKQPVVGFGSQLGSPGNRGGGLGMVGFGGAVGVSTGSPANQLSSNGIGKSSADNSSVSPLPYVFNGSMRGRKSGAVEKVAERRQRRMIKNRESAARSRARKQAYTTELEEEVAKLKEENEELQKQNAEIMEMQKNQVMETLNMQHGSKKRCLRRTLTGPW